MRQKNVDKVVGTIMLPLKEVTDEHVDSFRAYAVKYGMKAAIEHALYAIQSGLAERVQDEFGKN